jgi:C4-type Zn-finger protein
MTKVFLAWSTGVLNAGVITVVEGLINLLYIKQACKKKTKDTQFQQQQSSCRVTFSNAIPSQDQAQ